MKRLLLLLALCLILAAPVSATVLDFQENGTYTQLTCLQGYSPAYICYWSENTTGGNNFWRTTGEFTRIQNTNAIPFTYAAFTVPVTGGTYSIGISDATNTTQYTYVVSGGTPAYTRYEIKVVGSTAYFYQNGIQKASVTGLASNPAFLRISCEDGGAGPVRVDDLIIGDTESKWVVDLPRPNAYYLKKDMINPSASGLYNSAGSLMYSNYLPISFSRSNISDGENAMPINESIYLVNKDSGTVYATVYTGNASGGERAFNVANALFTTGAPYGRYTAKLNTTYSEEEIMYIANGATISFNKHDYNQNDVAYLTYLIDGAYWDTSLYTYSIKIYRANDWTVIHTQGITSTTGTDQYQFTASDTQGTYYAVIVATPNVGGDDIWMIFDYAQMNAYFAPYGYVNDAETAQVISGANVTLVQGSTVSTTITDANGNYTASGFITGLPIIWNVTAAGHFQYNVTMTATTTGSKYINITLNSTTPSYTGLGIGGVVRDGILTGSTITSGYGRPIGGATCHLRNQTGGESCTNVTNNAAWYLFDEGNGCVLTTKRPYDVWCSKLGYSNSPNYTAVAA